MSVGRIVGVASVLMSLLFIMGFGAELAAQGPTTPPPTLRAYTHIFLAYAAAWILLLLWVLKIARKLKQAADL